MKHIFTPALIAFSFFVTSCSNSDDDKKNATAISPYAGYYTVLQAESDVPVDLDNNGTANTDLMAEIAYFHHVPYDIFLQERTNGFKLMNFHIPHPNIPDDMESFNVEYAHAAWGVEYQYSSAANEIVIVTDVDTDYYRRFGAVQSIDIINDTTLKCTIRKDYYDYQTGGMKNILLTLVFQKVSE